MRRHFARPNGAVDDELPLSKTKRDTLVQHERLSSVEQPSIQPAYTEPLGEQSIVDPEEGFFDQFLKKQQHGSNDAFDKIGKTRKDRSGGMIMTDGSRQSQDNDEERNLESSSESSSDSSSDIHVESLSKPVFVKKRNGTSSYDNDHEKHSLTTLRGARKKSTIARFEQAVQVPTSHVEEVTDTDDLDAEGEYWSWVNREKARMARDHEQLATIEEEYERKMEVREQREQREAKRQKIL